MKRKPKEPGRRSGITAAMNLHTKPGRMRDRRCRRPKDAKHSWRREEA